MEIIYATKRVEDFVLGLDDETASRVDGMIELLGRHGPKLGMPQSKSLGAGLFELRILGAKSARILYTFLHNKVYLISGFFKKTSKIPKHEIDYARDVLKELLA